MSNEENQKRPVGERVTQLDKKTLDCIFSRSITVTGYVEAPWGGDNIFLSKDDLEKYIEDFPKFCADHYELTSDQYQRWMATHGTPQCGEKTKRGNRCKRQSGGSQLPAKEWLEKEGGICVYHKNEERHEKMREFRKRQKL